MNPLLSQTLSLTCYPSPKLLNLSKTLSCQCSARNFLLPAVQNLHINNCIISLFQSWRQNTSKELAAKQGSHNIKNNMQLKKWEHLCGDSDFYIFWDHWIACILWIWNKSNNPKQREEKIKTHFSEMVKPIPIFCPVSYVKSYTATLFKGFALSPLIYEVLQKNCCNHSGTSPILRLISTYVAKYDVLTMTCWSEGMNSRAFWMTLQPYICKASDSTWPLILSARASFWSRLPNWKTRNEPVNGLIPPITQKLQNSWLGFFSKLELHVCTLRVNSLACETHLKEFLDDIISKDVHHELVCCLEYLTEDKLALCWTGSLQFQLDKPSTDRKDKNYINSEPWIISTDASVALFC